MPDMRKASIFTKDKSIDTGKVRNDTVRLEPFVFHLFLDTTQFAHKAADQTRMRHNHRNFELQYFAEGTGTFEAGDHTFPILPGSFCLIGPNVYHILHPDTVLLKYTIQFDYVIHDSDPQRLKIPWCIEIIRSLSEMTYLYIPDNTRIAFLLDQMKEELLDQPVLYESRIDNILSEVMIELLRSIVNSKSIAQDKKADEDMRDFRIEIFFDENYWRPELCAEQMAGAIGISARHLNRLIQKNFNTTFKQKLIKTRIESAKGFLVSSDSTVSEIAENVGFCSAEYFYKSFKRMTGITPGEYRKVFKA